MSLARGFLPGLSLPQALNCQYTEYRIPGWATSTFRLVCGALNEWARLDSRLGHELFFSVGFGVKKKELSIE